jgi:hypothetical protein
MPCIVELSIQRLGCGFMRVPFDAAHLKRAGIGWGS